jgi:uracil-DNA glycosylase
MPRITAEPPGYPEVIPSPPDLHSLHRVMVLCTRCDLASGRTQVVPGSGPPRTEVLIVGEAPGASEDRQGIPFVGASGRLLDQMLGVAGFERKDVFIANVVRCRPPANRSPRASEIRACAGWLAEQIRLIEPSIVVPLGRFALQHFLPGAKITRIKGEIQVIGYAGRDVSLYPLLHPAAILRSPDRRPEYEEDFRRLGAITSSVI